MEFKLEVVVLPVSDVDRAKQFYVDKMGFHLDVDTTPTSTMRVVQLTPPGSACSVTIGPNIIEPGSAAPSSRLQLVVDDIDAAHALLTSRGVECSPVTELAPGDGGRFVFLEDPDGNGWAVQELKKSFG